MHSGDAMKKEYSLFIGRYQPFHEGHKKLIEVVLNEGKNVCIALRDTERDPGNPHSLRARKKMISSVLQDWIKKGKVIIMTIPDVIEVCYGRKVGWGIREIKLDDATEEISATKIRSEKS